jgi:hypothetical protein
MGGLLCLRLTETSPSHETEISVARHQQGNCSAARARGVTFLTERSRKGLAERRVGGFRGEHNGTCTHCGIRKVWLAITLSEWGFAIPMRVGHRHFGRGRARRKDLRQTRPGPTLSHSGMAIWGQFRYTRGMTTKLRSKLMALWPMSKQQAASAARAKTQTQKQQDTSGGTRPPNTPKKKS